MTRETALTAEYEQYEVYAVKFLMSKEQSILISDFNMDAPHLLGGLGERKELSTLLMEVRITEMCNAHDGVRGLLKRLLK